MRRRRWRTAVLWVGCALCVLIAVAFVVSGWWWMEVQFRGGPFIVVHGGRLECYYPAGATRALFSRSAGGLRHALVVGTWAKGFTLGLVYPFAAVALSTLLLWRFRPKPPRPGHCRCGYDLTGNTSGVCPECGVEVKS